MPTKKTNLIIFGIDSLRADRMSCYGYERQTTPHIDKFAEGGVLFEQNYSAHIPTTSAYASMLTGKDCFTTSVVALRHQGGLPKHVRTLPEILKKNGYNTSCVGFSGNPSSRGFDKYIDYPAWGSWATGRSPKAEKLNEVAVPELDRLSKSKKPFFLFLRHMDPHAPYLPPAPYERMFYSGNEFDPKNKSMEPVFKFKPFCDFFADWMPPGVRDRHYIDAQYDGAIAYMDACIQRLITRVEELGLVDDTLIVINGDHGETLYEHDCWYDHHGMYDNCLHVPLIIRLPGKVPASQRVKGMTLHQDLTPTVLQLLNVKSEEQFDGQSLLPLISGKRATNYSEFYITECTWMRKHGWRTPEWKLMIALEPDFHFKPRVELYNLIKDPLELKNLANKEKKVAALLEERMMAHIAQREKATGAPNPMYNNLNWHGSKTHKGPFETSQQAYDTLHIGSVGAANKLQAGNKKKAAKKR